MLSILQLLLLTIPSSNLSIALYRLHLYWVTGPLLAILFPVTDSLYFSGEVAVYWVQHLLLILVPAILLPEMGVEHIMDWTWPTLAFSIFSLYHWLILHPIGDHPLTSP